MGRRRPCVLHRAALVDFVDRRETGPGTAAALGHLDRCRACQAELAEILLTIHALRRVLGEAGRAVPPGDAWDRLRSRVQRPVGGAWQSRGALAGVVLGAGLVAALVGPTAVVRSRTVIEHEPGPAPAVLRAHTVADQQAETAFLKRVREERPAPAALAVVVADPQWFGPDGLGKSAWIVLALVPPGRAD